MARVKGNVIGNLSGKLGNLAARIRKGSTILCARPSSFNAPSDISAIERRDKFSVNIKFAMAAYSLECLRKVWDKVREPELSVLNQIFKANYPMASVTRPTIENIICPKNGFAFAAPDALVDQAKVTATIPALNTVTVINPEEVHLCINALVCFHTPIIPGDEPFSMVHLSKIVPNYNFGQSYAAQLDFNVLQAAVAAKYDSSILYLSVVPKTADEKILQYSATYHKAF